MVVMVVQVELRWVLVVLGRMWVGSVAFLLVVGLQEQELGEAERSQVG